MIADTNPNQNRKADRSSKAVGFTDDGYLPPAQESTKVCGSLSPETPYYRCTRGLSHKGDHAAHGDPGNDSADMLARWPRVKRLPVTTE